MIFKRTRVKVPLSSHERYPWSWLSFSFSTCLSVCSCLEMRVSMYRSWFCCSFAPFPCVQLVRKCVWYKRWERLVCMHSNHCSPRPSFHSSVFLWCKWRMNIVLFNLYSTAPSLDSETKKTHFTMDSSSSRDGIHSLSFMEIEWEDYSVGTASLIRDSWCKDLCPTQLFWRRLFDLNPFPLCFPMMMMKRSFPSSFLSFFRCRFSRESSLRQINLPWIHESLNTWGIAAEVISLNVIISKIVQPILLYCL